MTKANRYPQELRERAVRMVMEHRGSTPRSGRPWLDRQQVRDSAEAEGFSHGEYGLVVESLDGAAMCTRKRRQGG